MEIVNYLLIGLFAYLMLRQILPTKGVKQITTSELKNSLNDHTKQYIDVRTVGEFTGRNIKGFKNIPLHELSKQANTLSKEKEVVVICQSGMRSNKASKLLKKLGFKQVTNVKGGMSAWV
ncbi:rhodanese-like domain-containing protein [Bacillus sp. 31A1R]|uniref:Rhodanese-like domain-containing protein n=1 Tax=Robertmurraya mangrovi TaxID=3098077 RepID=A0ABU5IVV1_9BACI|nr:rhodanese-like domain-containing protein [Bacillus sp. 31A1R]MDZ5471269.1 rhodanese-like domain-containing protein [Bacillus sp. 31A1R]